MVYTQQEVDLLLIKKDMEVQKKLLEFEAGASLKVAEINAKDKLIAHYERMLDNTGMSLDFTQLVALVQTAKANPIVPQNNKQDSKPEQKKENN